MRQRWEYWTRYENEPLSVEELNRLGKDDWELVGFTCFSYIAGGTLMYGGELTYGVRFHYVFKRAAVGERYQTSSEQLYTDKGTIVELIVDQIETNVHVEIVEVIAELKLKFPGLTEEAYRRTAFHIKYRGEWVYFVLCGAYVKVGVAKDVTARIKALQTAAPDKLVPLLRAPGGRKLERTIHKLLREYHSYGEWFHYTKEVELLIVSLKDNLQWSETI